jgi:hypothetical protein
MREYRATRRTALLLARDVLLICLMLAGALIAGIIAGVSSPVTVLLALLGALGITASMLARRKVARILRVNDDGLSGVTFAGVTTYISWGDISAFESTAAPTFGGHHRTAVRSRKGQKIIFTDVVSDYDSLVEVIKDRAGSADSQQVLTGWERLLLLA